MPLPNTNPAVLDTWLDKRIGRVAPQWALKRRQSRMLLSAYSAGETTRLRNNWGLGLQRESTPDTHKLSQIRDASRHANRTDPVASGATDTLKTNIVGSGLHPQGRIRADRIGISPERATELNRQAESAFRLWSPYADSGNRLDFDEIQFLALGKVVEDGESIVIPTWAKESWRPFGRCLEMIESDRMDYTSGKIRHGIEVGKRGEPITYHIRKADPYGVVLSSEHVPVKARDAMGRPNILHIFQAKRPGQLRGIPFFAPVLTYFKDVADYLEASIVTARVAACLAVFVTKADPMGAAMNMGPDTETGTGNRIQALEPGLINYLKTGEAINVVEPKQPGENFAPFIETMFRIIGVQIGLPYELLIKDFSKTNYSSARAALLEGRRMFIYWRNWLARKLCQPVYEMVLEEAFLRGMFDAKNFYEFKHEYCRANWIGGGWGWVDPVKEIEASRMAIDYGLSTLAEEAAGQGRDWEEIVEQRKKEETFIEKEGVNISRSKKGLEADKTGEKEDATKK